MGLVVLGHNDATTGLLVESVDDTGSVLLRSCGEGASMVEQGIDKSALFVSRSDMDDHSGRFVDHQQIGIFMEDLQGNILGSCPGGEFGRFFLDPEEVSLLHLITAADRFSTQGDLARFHERLNLGTGKLWEIPNQNHVESLATILFGGCDFVDGWMSHDLVTEFLLRCGVVPLVGCAFLTVWSIDVASSPPPK